MNNIFVYCEIEEGAIAYVSFVLLTKGRQLADELGCQLEAVVIGSQLDGIENQIYPYGADVVHVAVDPRLAPYTTLPLT